jgi:aminoglycoside/choline kinase family phosphotransferase
MDKIIKWLQNTEFKDCEITIASSDASFRKYYRLSCKDNSFILMDSSLEKSSLIPFLDITKRVSSVDVKAPKIYKEDIESGYLIIEDFGDTNLLDILNTENFKRYYQKAIDEILKMQDALVSNLKLYDKEFLQFEMSLMQEWYLDKNLGLKLKEEDKAMLAKTIEDISDVVLSQPQGIFVHRDFHSRNIMITPNNEFGVIDYQDAMSGALTYDLASLLKDCYISFPRQDIILLALEFKKKANIGVSDEIFIKWFDFMGMQRHIKVLGVFSRLFLRDKKDGYLKDIPLTLKYTIETAKLYTQTRELALFLEERCL